MPSYRFYVRKEREDLIMFLNEAQRQAHFSELVCDALEMTVEELVAARQLFHKGQSKFWNDIHKDAKKVSARQKQEILKLRQLERKEIESALEIVEERLKPMERDPTKRGDKVFMKTIKKYIRILESLDYDTTDILARLKEVEQ